MNRPVLLFFIFTCIAGVPSSWSRISVEDLAQGFHSLQSDVDRLTQANAQLVERIRPVEENVQWLGHQRDSVQNNGELLMGDLALWQEKAKAMAGIMSAAVSETEKIKTQLSDADEKIAAKKARLDSLEAQQ